MRKTTVTCDRCKKEINRTFGKEREPVWQIQLRADAGDKAIEGNTHRYISPVFNLEFCHSCTVALGIAPERVEAGVSKRKEVDPFDTFRECVAIALDGLGVVRE